MSQRQYLGDSVYVDVERGMLKLTTDNGYGPSNTIYLEDDVLQALLTYLDALRERARVRALIERIPPP